MALWRFERGTIMTIKIDNAIFGTALKSMQKLAQPEVVTLVFKGQTLIIKGAGQSNSCRVKLDIESDEESKQEVTVDIATLVSTTDKLKELEFEVSSSSLKIKSRNFKVDITAIDGQPVEVVPKEVLSGSEGFVLGSKLMAELLRYLPKIELRPLLSTYSECPIGIKSGPNGTFVACFDFVQSAFLRLKTPSKEKFEFVLPSIGQFNTLTKELSGQKYRLVITDTTLYAFNDVIQVALALPQQEGEQLQLADVIGLAKSVKELKYKRLVLNTDKVKHFLSNSRAVYDKDSLFTLTAKGDKAKVELKATVGNTAMTMKLEEPVKRIEIKCDLNFFSSIVNKSSAKQLELQATSELLLLKEGKISYLLSLV
jgi:hypothetical protein